MPSIVALAEKHGLFVVEDCAQSIGATIDGKFLGTFGHAAAFSFCQDKIITTGGEGGMILAADPAVLERVWAFKDHGKSFAKSFASELSTQYRWIHTTVGTNARMTEMQAAIGLRQLSKLEGWLATRQKNAHALASALAPFSCVRMTPVRNDHRHVYYRLACATVPENLRTGWNRDRLIAALRAEGIPVSVGTCPEIYREGAYAEAYGNVSFPNARKVGETCLAFLTHPTITDTFMSECQAGITKVFSAASR